MKKLKYLYFSLFKEITNNNFYYSIKWSRFYKSASYPMPGFCRYIQTVTHSEQIQFIDPLYYKHEARKDLDKLISTKQIFDYLIENNLTPFDLRPYEEDLKCKPSTTNNLIAGFIGRMLENNYYNPSLSQQTFEKTFFELETFFSNDIFSYKILVSLHGPIGDIDNIQLDNVSIKMADYEISKLFCMHFSDSGPFLFEMLEKDYYLELEGNILKCNRNKPTNNEIKTVESFFNFLLLSQSGNIELGNIMIVSSCWPLMDTLGLTTSPMKINKYEKSNVFRYNINERTKSLIEDTYEKLKNVDFNKLDEQIKASLKRLIKSKSTHNIEDKIIELVLSIEYLINTATYEVTLQLCLKMIKMYDEANQDVTLFKLLKNFFVLRGNVVHGNKRVTLNDENIELVRRVEEITLTILVRFIILNQKYSYQQINKALDKSLYLEKKIDCLLEDI